MRHSTASRDAWMRLEPKWIRIYIYIYIYSSFSFVPLPEIDYIKTHDLKHTQNTNMCISCVMCFVVDLIGFDTCSFTRTKCSECAMLQPQSQTTTAATTATV